MLPGFLAKLGASGDPAAGVEDGGLKKYFSVNVMEHTYNHAAVRSP